jgi:hypothetical protein
MIYLCWTGIAQPVKRRSTGWTTKVLARAEYFYLLHRVQIDSRVHSTSSPVGPSGIEADLLPPLAPRSKLLSRTSVPQYAFLVWCLIKHRDTLTFTVSHIIMCWRFTYWLTLKLFFWDCWFWMFDTNFWHWTRTTRSLRLQRSTS